MIPGEEMEQVRDQQGWSDATLLLLAMQFIRSDPGRTAEFTAYLRHVAAVENEAT